MPKKTNLADALDDVTPAPATAARPVSQRVRNTPVIQSREGTELIGAHLPARYGKAMRLLSAETGQTQRELFREALDMLFVKKGAKV